MTVGDAMEVESTEEVVLHLNDSGIEDEEASENNEYADQVCGGRDFLSHPVLLDSKSGHILTAEENKVLVFSSTTGQLLR
jgi:hypothetical protein